MKKLLIISLWLFLIVTGVNAQIIKTVGATGANYPTLKSAFDAINAGTISGTITLQITGSTNETSSAAINASGAGSANYSSITIYPVETGITVSGNISGSLIQFNGADNVTVDGRVNGTGSTKDLTISNTNNATSATILFINSAENNIVKYCAIKGSETSSGKGVIHFSTASSGNGNDGNIIDNNNITSSASGRPINAVYSYGSAGYENSGNIISNNNIYDFLRTSNNSNGVNPHCSPNS